MEIIAFLMAVTIVALLIVVGWLWTQKNLWRQQSSINYDGMEFQAAQFTKATRTSSELRQSLRSVEVKLMDIKKVLERK